MTNNEVTQGPDKNQALFYLMEALQEFSTLDPIPPEGTF